MVKGHTEFLGGICFSMCCSLFFFPMNLWKPPLKMSCVSQHKCFSSLYLFTICGDSQRDLYMVPCYTITQSAERGRLLGCVLRVILMDSEPFSCVFSPPTNMWWWPNILLQQQIPFSSDPTPAPGLLLFHMSAFKSVFFCGFVFYRVEKGSLQLLGTNMEIALLISFFPFADSNELWEQICWVSLQTRAGEMWNKHSTPEVWFDKTPKPEWCHKPDSPSDPHCLHLHTRKSYNQHLLPSHWLFIQCLTKVRICISRCHFSSKPKK